MKVLITILFFTLTSGFSHAIKITDSRFFDYQVRFTNPKCKLVMHKENKRSINGKKLEAYPKNVYCRKNDGPTSRANPESPFQLLKDSLLDGTIKSVFMAHLSFSNKAAKQVICQSIQSFEIPYTIVVDQKRGSRVARSIRDECSTEQSSVRYLERGGKRGLGWAHNKLIVIRYKNSTKVKIIFGSGNMSSGLDLHHENWHFITTSTKTYFAQTHFCLINGMLDHGNSRNEFSKFMAKCRRKISQKEETDIKVYFVPAIGEHQKVRTFNRNSSVSTKYVKKDGEKAFGAITNALITADKVSIAAHRFSFNRLIAGIKNRLNANIPITLIVDDDLFFKKRPNNWNEFKAVKRLEKAGLAVKYMETNGGARLLHHNKFMIFHFDGQTPDAVFAGAGNFTGTAFTRNFENFYYITIPKVVRTFKKQYQLMWNQMATLEGGLPREN